MLRVSTSRSWRGGNQRGAAAAAGEGRQLLYQKQEILWSPCSLSMVQEIPSSQVVQNVLRLLPGILKTPEHSGQV